MVVVVVEEQAGEDTALRGEKRGGEEKRGDVCPRRQMARGAGP